MERAIEETFNELKEYKRLTDKRLTLEEEILREIKKKWENVESIYVNDSSISVDTKKHTIRLSSYGHLKNLEPTMICDEKSMPKTVDEFIEVKKMIEEDNRQCMAAFYWLFYRYDFGWLKYNGYKGV